MAGNRCPDCNKFVALNLNIEDLDVEVSSFEEIDSKKGMLTLNIMMSKVCAECGTEILSKETGIEVEIDLTDFEAV